MSSNENLWLIGAGPMAADYARVLDALKVPLTVIGRGSRSAETFAQKTGVAALHGGLDAFLASSPAPARRAIVSVGVEALAPTTRLLLEQGVSQILVEKPGALHKRELDELVDLAARKSAKVFVAYNRRMFASTLRARQMIASDGGVQSMHFEFTEWNHVIRDLTKADGVKPAWLLANSTHVIDLAFHLGGLPVDWHAYTRGALAWHPASSMFSGAGVTDRDVLFSYQANWDAPGRWSLEVLTAHNRLIFKPMETLQVMRKGSVAIETVEIDDRIDKAYKPGLHEQVRRFLAGEFDDLCALEEQARNWALYSRIANYRA